MARNETTFKKGHRPTKKKGDVTKAVYQAKELIMTAINSNSELFNSTMLQLQKDSPLEWAKIMVKLMDFVIPKKLGIDVNAEGEKTPAPTIIMWGAKEIPI